MEEPRILVGFNLSEPETYREFLERDKNVENSWWRSFGNRALKAMTILYNENIQLKKNLITTDIERMRKLEAVVEAMRPKHWVMYRQSDSETWPYPPYAYCRFCGEKYTNGSYKLTGMEAAHAWGPLIQHADDCPITLYAALKE